MGNRVSTVSDLLTIRIGGERPAPGVDKKRQQKSKKAANNRIKSTKYTLWSFLPQNLLEQFRRIANFYFLVMVVISSVIDSPVSPLTSLVPLVFVIAVTAAKQGYEDFLRFRADNMVNYSLVTVIRNGEQLDVRSQDILQGDLVKAARDCDVPCDLVLLMSSDAAGKVYITTANLDGETNLKTLSVPRGLPETGIDQLHNLGTIECEQPRTDLYTFNGRIELSTAAQRHEFARLSSMVSAAASAASAAFAATDPAAELGGMRLSQLPTLDLGALDMPQPTVPLMADNLLLRGSRIKNTEWAIGCAVYTGQQTKLSLNSRLTRNKMSSSEKFVNKYLIFFLLLLITMVTVSYFLKRYFDREATEHNVYLGPLPDRWEITNFLQDFFSFLILFNYLIPISLYVTIEFHKFFGAFFMEWDEALYDADTNQPFIVNTSDLNEELGQVKYLFSDKTGTLTKNEMILQQCSIAGKIYEMSGTGIKERNRINKIKIGEFRPEHMAFFQTLATCHTVQVAGDEGEDEGLAEVGLTDVEYGEEAARTVAVGDSVEMFGDIAEENGGAERSVHPAATDTTDKSGFRNRLQLLIPTEYLDDELPAPDKSAPPLPPRPSLTNTIASHPSHQSLYQSGAQSPRVLRDRGRPLSFAGADRTAVESNPFGGVATRTLAAPTSPAQVVRGRVRLQRPMSTIYPTEKSAEAAASGHRRTQSYVAPTTYSRDVQTDADRRRQSKTGSLTRYALNGGVAPAGGSVVNLREYYVAPSFQRASLVERTESMRRRNQITSVVKKLDYQASSPDEKALVEGCAKVGFLYTGEVADTLTVRLQQYRSAYNNNNINNNTTTIANNNNNNNDNALLFDRLSTIEFTSDRKRMSTVLRDRRDGQLWLLTKGAESHVLPLCANRTPVAMREATLRHINEFARIGLRTLAVARRKLTLAEYEAYEADLTAAATSLAGNRRQLMDEVDERLEQDLELLGATAVEDALQDDVRDTLESLRFAGIKVWVLTGDKVETALNIALSCGHIPEESERYFITECTTKEQLDQHLDVLEYSINRQPDDIFSLLIDGASLAVALKETRERFRDTSMRCRAVLCCRLSPLQKCEVVQLIKSSPGHPITGAIGDGANDVSMIQEAHVGLGIVGKEGRQAARCADYAFANFSMLKRVLLVHGYYYSHRLSVLVLYFFYKNLVFMLIQFYFQMNSMFSSESVYDSLFLTLYNVMYTSVPVLLLSLTEKLHTETRLMKNPPLYTENEGNRRFHWKYFIGWMTLGAYHSAIIYVTAFYMWSRNAAMLPDPYTVNFYCFGTFLMHNVVTVVNLKLWLVAKYQSNWFIVSVIGSILLFVASTLIYNLFSAGIDGDMLYVYITLLGSPSIWLLFLFVLVGCLLPDYTIKACCDAFGLRMHGLFPGGRVATEKRRVRKLFSYRRRRNETDDVESTNL